MAKEIDASKAIHKLREAQLILREVNAKCIQVGYLEIDKIVREIQEIKDRLFPSTPYEGYPKNMLIPGRSP